jgi:hypothetical protein
MVVQRGQIRRIGWVIKTLEAQVRQFLLGYKCPVSRFIPGWAKDLSAPRYRLTFCIQFGRNSVFKVLQYIFAICTLPPIQYSKCCSTYLQFAHYLQFNMQSAAVHICNLHITSNSICKVLQYIFANCTLPPIQYAKCCSTYLQFAYYLPCVRMNHLLSPYSCDIHSKLRALFRTNCTLCLFTFYNVTPCSPVNAY